jgi:ankyrin repeat protein
MRVLLLQVFILPCFACVACHGTTGETTDPQRPATEDIALITAIEGGDLKKAKSALDAGADPSGGPGKGYYSPLRDAAQVNIPVMVELLLKYGADPNAASEGDRPLVCAAYEGSVEIVKLLVGHGADLEPANGSKPLLVAASRGKTDVIVYLIAKGAHVTAADGSGYTALHRAARAGQVDAVRVLLASGADPASRDKWGRTPLDLAKHEAIRKLLAAAIMSDHRPATAPTTER